jgi:hypothetical protein
MSPKVNTTALGHQERRTENNMERLLKRVEMIRTAGCVAPRLTTVKDTLRRPCARAV